MKEALSQLIAHILKGAKYLNYGIYDATYQDGRGVIGTVNNRREVLLPNDRLNNYLFAVVNGAIDHKIALNTGGYINNNVYQDTATIDLCVVVKDMCVYDLIDSVRSALVGFTNAVVTMQRTEIDKSSIVRSYMGGLDRNDIEKVLQRYDKETIIKITLSITTNVDGCINPC